MILGFDPDTHTYPLDGDPLVSVTTVLAPLMDFSWMPPAVRAAALERGSLVHDAIAADNTRDLDDGAFRRTCPEYVPYLEAWRSFRESRRFVPLLNEYRVASPRHRVAGTLDTIGTMDGHGALVDFKTGDPRDVAADLQTAGYVALVTEWNTVAEDPILADVLARFPVLRRYAIQLRPDGTFRVEAYTKPTDFRDFFTLLASHHLIAKRRGRRAAEAA